MYFNLAKANIKSRKEAFIGTIILTMLIIMILTVVYSMKANVGKWIDQANEYASTGDLMVWIDSNDISDDNFKKLDNVSDVKSYDKIEAALVAGESKIYIKGKVATDTVYLMDYDQPNHKYKIFSDNNRSYMSDAQEPSEGYIYLPVSYKRSYKCDVSDEVLLKTSNMEKTFKIKGFMEEPACGAAVIGTKFFFVNSKDLESVLMNSDTEYKSIKEADSILRFYMLHIFQQDDLELNMAGFKEKIDSETAILSNAALVLTDAQSKEYTFIIPNIVCIVLYVFMGILFIVVLIMINHSIKSFIELEIKDIGALKSIGFNDKQIRKIYLIIYLLAEIIGTVLGLLLAQPLMFMIKVLFVPIIGGILSNSINFLVGIILFALIAISSSILIYIKSKQFGKIKTVSAITGRLKDCSFNTKRLNSIKGNKLDFGIALRSLRTDSGQYRGLMFVSVLLVFFMMIANSIANISENDIMEKFIGYRMDLQLTYDDENEKEIVDNFIKTTYGEASSYKFVIGNFQVGSSNYTCIGVSDTSQITGLISGRLPESDKEIITTQGVLDELGIKMNDAVSIKNNDKEYTYTIVGVYQTMVDMGLAICMTYDGIQLVNPTVSEVNTYAYVLKDHQKRGELIKKLKNDFDGKVKVESAKSSDIVGIFSFASKMITIVIYAFTVLFALIISYMISKKTFKKEWKDFGTLKSIGFSSGTLRKQFILRFFIVTVVGGIIGFILNIALGNFLFGAIFSMIGIVSYHAGIDAFRLVLPLVFNTVVFMLFSYISSRSIKKVEIKQLITE